MIGLDGSHIVSSNRESGYGRYDLALLPRNPTAGPAIVMEFKRTSDPAQLQAAAQEALRQITARRYDTELRQHSIRRILYIGLAFSGKELALTHAVRESVAVDQPARLE
jgi:PD-(D/E)XK nuclease superfamily protein